MKKLFLYMFFLLAITGCLKEEDLPTGDIMGKIVVRDDDFSYPVDQSAEVRLFSETTLIDEVTADSRGIYCFAEEPYGKYTIDILRQNYLKPQGSSGYYTLFHIGGASPTVISDIVLSEIPTFDLTIDSVAKVNLSYSLKIFIKVNGGEQRPNATLAGVLSNSPDVSIDNYMLMGRGIFLKGDYIFDPSATTPAYAYLNHFFYSDYPIVKSDSVFIRLYPVAIGQNYYTPFNIQALGRPSNVVGFKW